MVKLNSWQNNFLAVQLLQQNLHKQLNNFCKYI